MGGVRCGELDFPSGGVGGSVADRRFTAADTTGRADLRKVPADVRRGADGRRSEWSSTARRFGRRTGSVRTRDRRNPLRQGRRAGEQNRHPPRTRSRRRAARTMINGTSGAVSAPAEPGDAPVAKGCRDPAGRPCRRCSGTGVDPTTAAGIRPAARTSACAETATAPANDRRRDVQRRVGTVRRVSLTGGDTAPGGLHGSPEIYGTSSVSAGDEIEAYLQFPFV